MQVIGAGLPRTGTMSTQAALNQLGLRCYHMQEVPRDATHLDAWTALVTGKRPMDWHALFRDYEATVDAPACFYYEALMEAFPDAKILLNQRDAESWYKSLMNLQKAMDTVRPMGRLIPRVRKFLAFTETLMHNFVGPEPTKERFIEAHDRHDAAVLANVPADRLLVFKPEDGWGPLCEFVGREVPAGAAFPHLNESGNDSLRKRLQELLTRSSP